jgi:hypothetical protein
MSRLNIPQSVTSERKEFNPALDRLFKNAGISTPKPQVQQSWEEVDGLFQTVAEGLVNIGHEVNSSIKLMRSLGMNSNAEVAITVRGLTSDIESFATDLGKIKSRHEGFKGQIKDGEELALCLSVFNDYMVLNDRFRAVVFPAMLTVTEHLTDAMTQAKKKDELTDPTVISDAVVVESPKQEPSESVKEKRDEQ